MKWAIEQFEIFDGVLGGLLENWNDDEGLILITSDHGNMEDLSTRRHTNAKVPALLFGSMSARASFSTGLTDLTGIYARHSSNHIPIMVDCILPLKYRII